MADKRFNIPMTKVDVEKRLVYLRAASETTDHSNESMDYDKSKPNFEKWSEDAYERSGGKSYGNIREMHSNIAAGKLNEPLIFDDDAKTVDIVVYVSDDSSWQKVKDGVLTGGSIGGSYEDIKFDPILGVKRYVADLTEISLVDSPCNPDATITVVKSNGSVEMKKIGSSLSKGGIMDKSLQSLIPGLEKSLKGGLKKSFSFDDIQDRVKASIKCRLIETDPNSGGYSYGYDSYWNYGYFYVVAAYDDSIVINGGFGDNNTYYNIQVFYTIDESGVVTLGDSRIVHMVPEECNDNDGDNEALNRFVDKAASLMEKSTVEALSNESKGKLQKIYNKIYGGNEMTEQEIAKVAEEAELQKAVELVMSKFASPEEFATFQKAKNKKVKKDDMEAADGKDDEVNKADTEPDGDEADEKDTKKSVKKSLGESDPLSKALGSIDKAIEAMTKSNASLLKRIDALEAQPSSGGPVVTAQDKTLGGAPVAKAADPNGIDAQITMLKGVMGRTSDMGARDSISREIATLEMTRAHQNPVIFNG